MTGLSRLLEHWHGIVTAIGAVAVAAILIIREATHYLHPQQTERADPNTYLIVAISILIVTLAIRVEQLGHRVTADLKALTDARTEDDVERFKALRRRLDPNLDKVYGDHIERELKNVLAAIKSGQVTLTDMNEVSQLYRKMLTSFPRSELWSVSMASKEYFWGDRSILAAIDEFTKKRRGKMTRIFFLKGNAPDPEALEIMQNQARVNVRVYYVPLAIVPQHLKQLYLVSRTDSLVSRVNIDATGKVTDITTTIDPQMVQQYRTSFETLLALDGLCDLPRPADPQ
jgi:hypothetical protein